MTVHQAGIYSITNLVNGRRYIGSAVRFEKRWKEHRRTLDRGSHHSKFLLRDWRKRGSVNFEFKILLVCARDDLLFYEQAFIDFYKPEYNSAPIAGSQLGFKMSAESRAKLSVAAKRTKNFTGKRHSEESKARISASKVGEIQHRETIEKRLASILARHGKHPAKRKFLEYDIRLIRERVLAGHTQAALANFYRVGSSVISEICSRKAYSWVD